MDWPTAAVFIGVTVAATAVTDTDSEGEVLQEIDDEDAKCQNELRNTGILVVQLTAARSLTPPCGGRLVKLHCTTRQSHLAHVVVRVVASWPVRSLQGEYNQWQEDNARQVIEQAEKVAARCVTSLRYPRYAQEILHDYDVPALVSASKQAQMVVVGNRGLGAVGRAVLGLGQ